MFDAEYRRYSDDILIVCNEKTKNIIYRETLKEIQKLKLEIQTEKDEIRYIKPIKT